MAGFRALRLQMAGLRALRLQMAGLRGSEPADGRPRASCLRMAGPTAPMSKSVGNIRLRFGKFWGKLIKVRETDWKDG